jgi:hypothetical protein
LSKVKGTNVTNKWWSVAEMRNRLLSDEKVLAEAVIALYLRQTEDERQDGTTVHLNRRGFNCKDAREGVRLGRLLERGMRLSELPEELAWARQRMPYYVRQITRIANGEA